MLTSNFTKKEPVLVATPTSVSEIKIPETNIMTVLVDKTGKVYFGIDGQDKRRQLIEKMASMYKVNFSPEAMKKYTLLELTGNPMQAMKAFLNLPAESRDLPQNNLGIPADSTNNEFNDLSLIHIEMCIRDRCIHGFGEPHPAFEPESTIG